MCDEHDLARWGKRAMNRRTFGAGALAAGAAACAPVEGSAGDGAPAPLTEGKVRFDLADGTMDGEFYHPARGKHPGVILWPDIAGIRPAKRQMARRLASAGYAVLLANPYYRDVEGQQFADFAAFAGQGGFQTVTPWRGKFTLDTIRRDTSGCADWLLGQAAVDGTRGMGAQGYCMTGSFALLAPAAHSGMRAGASFHGGGLVREGEQSPHLMLREEAHYLVAIAKNDDAKAPGDKTALREAADAAGTDAEIEVYAGDHGWCVPDSPSYDEAEAERAWTRLLALYAKAL